MKPITIDPGSALAGAAVLGLTLLTASALQARAQIAPLAIPDQPIQVEVAGIPDPHDMVVIREEDGPYTVPTGKLLVLTGLGATEINPSNYVRLQVDGVQEIAHDIINYNGSGGGAYDLSSVVSVPGGFTVAEGQVITLGPPTTGKSRAWGYLVDA